MKKYENFCKALANLQTIQNCKEPYNIIIQTGMVALFEICFEQAWKAMKAILEDHGRMEAKSGSPKIILKLAYQAGMIEEEKPWLGLLETRNLLAHTYSEEMALTCIREIKATYIGLFEELKREIDDKWI